MRQAHVQTDHVGQRQEAPRGLEVVVLDEPAVHDHHAAALAAGVLERLDELGGGGEIVGQLYNFTDKGGREVALRPEMTPTLARMVAAHERAYKKPIKWFAVPQLFRYERQQKGRLREHFQFNADIIGESDLAADAELIRAIYP